MIAQLALEGYRWQMVPAYVLAGAIALWRIAPVGRRGWAKVVATGLGVVVFAVFTIVVYLVCMWFVRIEERAEERRRSRR